MPTSHQDEGKALVQKFSDSSRKVARVGKQFLVPHKFKKSGEVVTEETFDARQDISKLNLADLRFLSLWRENQWNDEAALKKANLTPEQAEKTFKKLAYFKTEDARIRALASQASPEMVLAKDVENLHTHELQDTDHKSLDRIAKITGAFKTAEVNITQNILNFPKMSPEAEAALKAIADKEADVIDAEVA